MKFGPDILMSGVPDTSYVRSKGTFLTTKDLYMESLDRFPDIGALCIGQGNNQHVGGCMTTKSKAETDRAKDFAKEGETEDQRRQRIEREKKNKDFSQVYKAGWDRIRRLADINPGCVKLYALLAEHIDGSSGAVCATQKVLSEILGVNERTIRRQSQILEDEGAIVRIKVGTGIYAYALDPNEVWKSWDNRKEYAAFITRTIVDASSARNAETRLKGLVSPNGDLFNTNTRKKNDPEFDPETGEIFE